MERRHKIIGVTTDSIGEELGIQCGDILLEVNNKPVGDVFDYHFLVNDEFVNLLIEKPDGEQWELEIEKEVTEDIGIEFEHALMDEYRSCKNKCIFCFIDQMPPGMRSTLYFKDDDARLSFLQGNYITLTNMSQEDIDRIILYKLAPINISVHTTNPDLRCHMLKNRFAGDALDKVKQLFEAGIEMNSQSVLCKGYNDGLELEKTIDDLSRFIPYMKSLSVVPAGLTKYRTGLVDLKKFSKEESRKVLSVIHRCQEHCLKLYSTRFVYASDEWYITAQLPIPKEENYEGFGQLENGVGMVRTFLDDFNLKYSELAGDKRSLHLSLVTGELFAPYLKKCTIKLLGKFPNLNLEIFPIVNHFFGEDITVTGLLTGHDIIEQLKGRDLGEGVLIPANLLRSGEKVFLDDVTLKDMEAALRNKIYVIKTNGISFIEEILKIKYRHSGRGSTHE